MTLVRREVPPSPARMLHALASIGYDPEVALCDIIDNSLDAGAQKLDIQLLQQESEEEGEREVISGYLIADDGEGMDETSLLNALKIGSIRSYSPHSLGKFGIGLKSAALSLGDTITVITKTSTANVPICAILSTRVIEETNEYSVDFGDVPDEQALIWRKHAPDDKKGTIVVISDLNESQPSFTPFRDYFRRYCSITYHLRMEEPTANISISVNGQTLKPLDPLFPAEADVNGPLSPETWTGKTVHRLLNPCALELAPGVNATIEATQLIHPPSFEDDGIREEKRLAYLIAGDPYTASPRHGFYIYRNARIIVMAERFRGIIGSQTSSWSFRGRMQFDELADTILKLDVKKRHCTLPRRARSNLGALIKPYQTMSSEAWRIAGRRESERKGHLKADIAEDSIKSTPVTDLSYNVGAAAASASELQAIKDAQLQISSSSRSAIQDTTMTPEVLDRLQNEGTRVILSQGLKGNVMYVAHPAPDAGISQVFVNTNNSWVSAAYAAAESNATLFVALHHLFTILSRTEIEIRSHPFSGFTSTQAEKVMEQFRRRAGSLAEDMASSFEETLSQIEEGLEEDGEE